MRSRTISEKNSPGKRRRYRRGAEIAIVFSQHVFVWTSLFATGSTIYIMTTGAMKEDTLPGAIVTLIAGSASIVHILFANWAAYLSTKLPISSNDTSKTRCQMAATLALRGSVTLWLLCCGMGVTFTLAKHPSCQHSGSVSAPNINAGPTCIVQRSSVGASLLALLISGLLFVLMQKVQQPFECHLFGVAKNTSLLPFLLPHKNSKDRPMYSEMSFKCRSSTSLSSNTLVASLNDSKTNLLPTKPENAFGLGIYAPKTNTAAFLAPRPLLSSIRSHTTMSALPHSSPLPPLPAYFPERYRRGSAMHQAIRPPVRPARPDAPRREKTVRIVPPSPALSVANLEAYNKSVESLSSVYSRSISGESPRNSQRPGGLGVDNRSYSSSSTATVKKSNLGAMRLASDPETVVVAEDKQRLSSEGSSESDINDAATLQAKLPSVKAISEFGDVKHWNQGRRAFDDCREVQARTNEDEKRQWSLPKPLLVRKTREIASIC